MKYNNTLRIAMSADNALVKVVQHGQPVVEKLVTEKGEVSLLLEAGVAGYSICITNMSSTSRVMIDSVYFGKINITGMLPSLALSFNSGNILEPLAYADIYIGNNFYIDIARNISKVSV